MTTSQIIPVYQWSGSSWTITKAMRWDGTQWNPQLPWPTWDNVEMRWLAEMWGWFQWIGNASTVIEEIGWPNNSDFTAWNTMGNGMLSFLDALKLDRLWYASSRIEQQSTVMSLCYSPTGPANDMSASNPQITVLQNHANPGVWHTGTTVIGADTNSVIIGNHQPVTLSYSGGTFSNLNPGVANDTTNINCDYWYPSAADWTYLASQGIDTVRLSLRWERLQPTLGAALNTSELNRLLTALSRAHAVNIGVVPCIMNNYGYFIQDTSGAVNLETPQMQSQWSSVTEANFVNLWTLLTQALVGNPGLRAYSIYNEPYIRPEGVINGSEIGTGGTFASGTITGWTASNANLTGDTTHQRVGSTGCLAVTATGSSVNVYSPYCAVTGGSNYIGTASVRASASNSINNPAYEMAVAWYDSGHNYLGYTGGYYQYAYSQGWTRSAFSATAPLNAAYCQVRMWIVSTSAVGDVFYFDQIAAYPTSSAVDAMGTLTWETISQATVNAIRSIDATTPIWIPLGGSVSGLASSSAHPNGPWIVDSANNTKYTVHPYFDYCTDSSGDYSSTSVGEYLASYALEQSAAIQAGF